MICNSLATGDLAPGESRERCGREQFEPFGDLCEMFAERFAEPLGSVAARVNSFTSYRILVREKTFLDIEFIFVRNKSVSPGGLISLTHEK